MASQVPIFDCLTHPTPDGSWYLSLEQRAGLSQLQKEMMENNISWAFAVGMQDIGGYSLHSYIEFIKKNQCDQVTLFPVCFYDQEAHKNPTNFLAQARKLGYCGIKIHPRISKIPLLQLAPIIQEANMQGLQVLLCTYLFDAEFSSYFAVMDELISLLYAAHGAKMILLHGLPPMLLHAREIVRCYPNVLLDLSFTLSRYEGSSVDLDLQFLFNNFDQRICIGSDHPSYSPLSLRQRFEFFSASLPQEKKENIAFKNLQKFTDLGIERKI